MRPRRPILSARAQVPEDLGRAAGDLRRMASEALEADPEGRPVLRLEVICSPELHWHFAHPEAFEVTIWDLIDDAMFLETAAAKIAQAYR